METRFIILFSITFFVFIIGSWVLRINKKRRLAKKEENPISNKEIIELLDDPLTGEKMRVSEKQNQYESSDEIPDEIVFYEENTRTSEHVLNKYYTEDGDLEREFILIKNHLLDNGFNFQIFSDSEIDFLEKSITFTSFEDWTCSDMYHKNNLSVFIANTISKAFNSKYYSRTENTNIVFWIKDFTFLGHYCFIKQPLIQNIVNVFIEENPEVIKGYRTEIIKKSSQEKVITDFFKNLNPSFDLEIEVFNSNIIIRMMNIASLDNMKKLLKSLKTSD